MKSNQLSKNTDNIKSGKLIMNFDVVKLYEMQSKLDGYIIVNHNVKEQETINERWIALLVELGELANETRCFKYWSLKSASEKNIVLEEYVDGVHFILSIGNTIKQSRILPNINEVKINPTKKELTNKFAELFTCITDSMNKTDIFTHNEVFAKFLELGLMLGFSSDDIYNAYLNKNQINFARQDNKY
ncbi:hypothetical protein ASO20_02380 [Mycoplasma sp. (ex Biomphalaria glabrata)]|uniref:dUTP diphosphatase n=1 Tax=Mycoplasma sp. (ex Biomphalaria glabrata) TaxID=1749074 RepID=UPI00073A871F|nr:dUTP diphosphatase [Mycoplasma sp. (ex Biomphalaria glabrata)]ALV23481.1 hypothetical protein ASO20_02380 [Mycoplasma sp. (ex Biomphalaria glabrata)]